MICPIVGFCIKKCKTTFMIKGISILVFYINEFLIFRTQLGITKVLELGSSIGMDYVYFMLIHNVVVVYTTWC